MPLLHRYRHTENSTQTTNSTVDTARRRNPNRSRKQRAIRSIVAKVPASTSARVTQRRETGQIDGGFVVNASAADNNWRSFMAHYRFIRVGAAIALGAGLVAGYGVVSHARGQAPASAPSAFVAITPCRLLDTRVSQNVGTRGTPLDADETAIFGVWGTNGDCTIPSGANAIVGNLTIVKIHQTGSEYLALFPASAARPKASTLNPDGIIATNGFTIALSDVGQLAVYNSNDQPDIIIDISGYYVDTTVNPPTT